MKNVRIVEVDPDLAGAYCGRLFAGAGGDVVCAEPATGATLRRAGDFLWEYLAVGKSSAVVEASNGLDELLAWADIVISSCDGDADEALAFHERVQHVNPSSVHVVTSGFGLTGPYRNWRHSPLIDWAAGGQLYVTGEPDREPLQGGGPWASYLTGATAAIGAQAALFHAIRTGVGQLVDVGAMEAMAGLHQWSVTMYTHTGCVKKRWGNRFGEAFHPIALYQCHDGWVSIVAPAPRQWEPLCITADMPDLLADENLYWPAVRFDRSDEIDPRINAWLAERSYAEAVAALQEAGVPASRLLTMSEVLEDEQLASRDYWMAADHLGPHAKHPRVPFRTDADVDDPQLRPAPQLGADTDAVIGRVRAGGPRPERPAIDLSSVRVLEFGMAWAGPLAGRFLADLGVDVVIVEHPAARGIRQVEDPDATWEWGELPPPHVRSAVYPNATPGERWWNRMGIFNKMNRNKRSVCLDAKSERGAEILSGLIANSDLVLQNYSPRGAKSLGIDWANARRHNPSVVTVAMSGFGETGPLAGFLSYGPVLQAHGGFDAATGYEGGGPVRIGLAFPDAVGGVHSAFAALDALWERALIGGPVHVDVSQLETLLSIAGDMLLATSVTGCDPVRHGNRSEAYARQGVYRCAGDDSWVAISAIDAEQLRQLAGGCDDEHITRWTSTRTPIEAAAALQEVGVAAFPAMTNQDIVEDPHIRARDFIATWDQVDVGPIEFPGFPIHFSAIDVELRTCPGLGDDNAAVLAERLDMPAGEVADLVKRGVLGDRPLTMPDVANEPGEG